MAKDPMDVILAEFSRWAAAPDRELSGEPAADAVEADLLLGLLHDHLGLDDPGRLKPGDLEDLLLNVYPRKVTVFDPADTQDAIPALRDLLAFLADTGRLTDVAARGLGRELDQVAPRFADAVMDRSRWGTARSIMQAMATDGVDITDSAAVQDWIAQYSESAWEACPTGCPRCACRRRTSLPPWRASRRCSPRQAGWPSGPGQAGPSTRIVS